ncbi:shikimate dehydrogenase [Haloimpatiens sp. FM7330]|uniref:shikimate dehydrogenase n=1 Tax=Haloimpatiens sp. FM7330 TaxID=3298610 RepID=UPI0036434C78
MKLFGLLGEKLGHSLSPQIHDLVFQDFKLEAYYHLFEVDKKSLKDACTGFKAIKVSGLNVTIPYKVEVMQYLDEVSEEAKKIGAVNTLVFQDNKMIGYNTDYYGFGMMLDKFKVSIKGKKAVVLGTGGASKAVVQYLEDNGINNIIFASTNIQKGKNIYPHHKIVSYDELNHLNNQDIIINCTPVGMHPNNDECIVDKNILSKFSAAVDLIYNPAETLFLKEAKDLGCKTINGLYMLVGQAIKAEELWNNVEIKKDVMDKIYDEILRNSEQ